MDFTGEYKVPASRDKVWEALNDVDVLKLCIDGCEELNKDSDTEFSAKVTAKVGPVRAKFTGKVTLSDIDPPNGYTISGEGQGGVAGFAKGGAIVKLVEGDGATILHRERTRFDDHRRRLRGSGLGCSRGPGCAAGGPRAATGHKP